MQKNPACMHATYCVFILVLEIHSLNSQAYAWQLAYIQLSGTCSWRGCGEQEGDVINTLA